VSCKKKPLSVTNTEIVPLFDQICHLQIVVQPTEIVVSVLENLTMMLLQHQWQPPAQLLV
jgi:hypothetical protein